MLDGDHAGRRPSTMIAPRLADSGPERVIELAAGAQPAAAWDARVAASGLDSDPILCFTYEVTNGIRHGQHARK